MTGSSDSSSKESPVPAADALTEKLKICRVTAGVILAKNGLFRRQSFREITVRSPLPGCQVSQYSTFLQAIARSKLPPETPEWAVEALADPKILGPLVSNAEIPVAPKLNMGKHPKLPESVLARIEKILGAWNKAGRGEGVLILHVDETTSGDDSSTTSTSLSDEQCLLLMPKITSSSGTQVNFSMGDRFCRSCLTCFPVDQPVVTKCQCGRPLEPINLMLTVHSHPTFDAFSSGLDSTFEIPHIAFHMTMGHVDQVMPYDKKCVLSFCTGSERIPIALDQLFDIQDWKEGAAVENWLKITKREEPSKTAILGPWEEEFRTPEVVQKVIPILQAVQKAPKQTLDLQAGAHLLQTIINDPRSDIKAIGSITADMKAEDVIESGEELINMAVSTELSMAPALVMFSAYPQYLEKWAEAIEAVADGYDDVTDVPQEDDELWTLATLYAEILDALKKGGKPSSTQPSSGAAA